MSALSRDEYLDPAVALELDQTTEIRSAETDFHLPSLQLVEVMCECGHRRCTRRIVLTRARYEAVRGYPNRFLISEGHEVAVTDQVVNYGTGYVVVAKNRRTPLHAAGLQ